MDGGLVEECAFLVAEPTPFVEVSTHVDDVNPQHLQRLVGRFFMIMDNGGMWEENRQIVAMDAASEVHILGIHKESFVEEPSLPYRLRSKQHEAAAEIWDIHDTVIAGGVHLVGLIAALHPLGGEESSAKDIERRGEQFAEALNLSVGINDAGHQRADLRVLRDELQHRIERVAREDNIGIDDQMKWDIVVDALADGYIMRSAITHVVWIMAILNARIKRFECVLIRGIIYPINAIHIVRLQDNFCEIGYLLPVGLI